MKRVTKMFVALLIAFVSFVGLSACGNGDKILSAQIISGTMETTVAKGALIDTSNAKALIEYKDNYETVDSSKLEFGTVDTSVVGTTKMKVKYGDYEFEVTIKVVATEADVSSISSLESGVLNDYNENKKQQATDEEGKRNEFYDSTAPLYVGDDNPFNFRIEAKGRDGANRYVEVSKFTKTVTVELKDESSDTYTVLDADTLATYVDLDVDNATFDFVDDVATDRDFRITIEAVNKDLGADEDLTKFTADIRVIDGYNVYNATDLSIYDNMTGENYIWNAKKEATGMTGKTTNAIIFQDNIKITRDDVPAGYFWNEATDGNAYAVRQARLDDGVSLQGSLKDFYSTGLYKRELADGETFDIKGNYFRLDLSEFPKALCSGDNDEPSDFVSKEKSSMMTAHICVFYNTLRSGAMEDVDYAKSLNVAPQINVSDIGFIGNGALNNEVENSGSIILMKVAWVNFNAYNTLQHNFYIGYFFERGLADTETNGEKTGTFIVDKCKGYSSYQCLFYVWGGEHVLIKNSEFVGAGGPAIIANHADMDNDDIDTGYPAYIDIVASNISSKVVGTEPWFVNYKATEIISNMKLLDGLYTGSMGLPNTGRSILVSEDGAQKLDLVGILMSDDVLSGTPIKGYIRMFDTQEDYDKYYASENPEKTTYGVEMNGEIDKKAQSGNLEYFESSGKGGYINSGASNNWDTSYFGFFQAQAVKAIIENDAFAALRTGLNTMNIKFSDEFDTLTLAEQKAEIKAHINGIKALGTANVIDNATALQALQGIYLYGFNKNPATQETNAAIKRDVWTTNLALLNKMDNKTVTIDELVTELCNQVDDFTNVSFAEGDYINIYAMCLGVVIRLF